MLQIFKKAKTKIQEMATSLEPYRDPMEVIAEIHEAFDSSTEKLLLTAKEILSAPSDNFKGNALAQLGFSATKEALETLQKESDRSYNLWLSQIIERHQQRYPNNKFITDGMVREICKKYGLVFGEVEYFIGHVPDKNVSEMLSFKLMDDDRVLIPHHYFSWDKNGYFKVSEIKTDIYGYLTPRSRFGEITRTDESIASHYWQEPFRICAPVKDFNMKNMRVEDGYKLTLNIPDPIVLQPVSGGYLIVTKWGLDGRDADLVNEKMN